jgi:hypothetical protein
MNENLNLKIRELKEKIDDLREYISSDFCTNYMSMYNQIKKYEQEIEDIKRQNIDN